MFFTIIKSVRKLIAPRLSLKFHPIFPVRLNFIGAGSSKYNLVPSQVKSNFLEYILDLLKLSFLVSSFYHLFLIYKNKGNWFDEIPFLHLFNSFEYNGKYFYICSITLVLLSLLYKDDRNLNMISAALSIFFFLDDTLVNLIDHLYFKNEQEEVMGGFERLLLFFKKISDPNIKNIDPPFSEI